MSEQPELALISFKICPFVQRAAIALNEKKVAYRLTHLEAGDDQPSWFEQISPLGKVPVLMVEGTPVFESAVILEYLEEVYKPSLHPAAALEKARQRAWMEFSSNLLVKQFKLTTVDDQASFTATQAQLQQLLDTLATPLAEETPFFAGASFALVDAAFAPLFTRLAILEHEFNIGLNMPERLRVWSQALLARESVQSSVVDDFEVLFLDFVKQQQGYLSH